MNKGGYVTELMREPVDTELEYFKNNPTVAGMATEDNKVILNPYSKLSPKEKEAVALNEAARVKMRTNPELTPNFELTPEQTKFLNSNTYSKASDTDRKATIAARILSGDPSAGTPTKEQLKFVDTLKKNVIGDEQPEMMAKGGQVRSQTQRMLKKGGMMQEGGTVDPVSGNDVPVGAMQEEVRDDIPAQLSEGEFVFPADVVRFIGLERLMMMRQAAKEGLGKMEDMGQMSNADEATEEDDGAFESQIDEIMGELGEEEDDVEMAVGGMATEPAAMAQTQQALAQDQQPQQPQVPTLTEEQLAFIQQTASGMKAQQMQVSPEQQSMPTEGLTSAAIIKNNLQPGDPEKTQQYLSKIDRLIRANRAIITRHNDTVVIGFVKQPGVVDPIVFSNDAPEKLLSAVVANMNTAKSAGISKFESDKSNPLLVDALIKSGYPVKDNGNQGWSLTLE
jgi:hypothetical protein